MRDVGDAHPLQSEIHTQPQKNTLLLYFLLLITLQNRHPKGFFTVFRVFLPLYKYIEIIEIASFYKLIVYILNTEFLENRVTVREKICADTESVTLYFTAD